MLNLSTIKKADDEVLRQIEEEKRIRKTNEVFLFFPLGSQTDHLIKQSLDKLGVFCLVADPASVKEIDVIRIDPIGIILSGGPVSVYENPPSFDKNIFDIGIPILGICLGFQLWAQHISASVSLAQKREFGIHSLNVIKPDAKLFFNCGSAFNVVQSHGDIVNAENLIEILASTVNSPVAAGSYLHLFGLQFHPEVSDTENGLQIIENFCFLICEAKDKFPAKDVAQQKIIELAEKLKEGSVLLGLSGGADSSTQAFLLKKARELAGVTEKIEAIYIKGVDRPDDLHFVEKYFANTDWLNLHIIDATDDFLQVLKDKVTMPEKRLAMREVYKNRFEAFMVFSALAGIKIKYISQGTLYTDISESGGGYESGVVKAQIKLHHNVNLNFSVPELCSLIDCVKDTARSIGREIGVPEELLVRHPFPGPGMVVRIEGEIDSDKLRIVRQADDIFIEELRKADLYKNVWQAGAVVTNSVHTCSKGDGAASGLVVALWAVYSVNGFTARFARPSWDFLDHVSTRITNEIKEVGAVVYRISNKPPTTIEWG
jgi:GMP synthase (glutamine-hydrolysing)